MNTANYKNSLNKYPISTDTLEFIQNQIKLIYTISDIYGKNFILRKPTPTTDGIIVIEGEILPFQKGVQEAYIRVVTTNEDVVAKAETFVNARTFRYAEYTDTEGYNVSNFKEITNITQLVEQMIEAEKHQVPKGAIIMWGDTTPPMGWKLCEGKVYDSDGVEYFEISVSANTISSAKKGTLAWLEVSQRDRFYAGTGNGKNWVEYSSYKSYMKDVDDSTIIQTPDLRGKFVLGVSDSYVLKTSGGEETHRLTEAEMPRHNHSATVPKKYDTDSSGSGGGATRDYSTDTVETTFTGGNVAHNNMPPYYVLAYIIKIV